MNLWDTYVRYFRDFQPILRSMSTRGIPVSETERMALKGAIQAERIAIVERLQGIVPKELRATKQKSGLKRPPKDLTGLVEMSIVIEKEEKCSCLKKTRPTCPVCLGSGMVAPGTQLKRWAKPLEFNPQSPPQVKKLLKHLGYVLPKHTKRTNAQGEAAETTEVKELERLNAKRPHPVFQPLIEFRQLGKIEGTYVDGWEPWKDGRVHTTYTFGPATWQLSAKAPNVQNGIKHAPKGSLKERFAKAFNAIQKAEPGHVMVNIDAKSFHAQTTACEAGLGDYLRLAKIDVHSFVACHYLRLPERVGLLELPDAEMTAIFKRLKSDPRPLYNGQTFKYVRDFKAKRVILGIQFGMGPRKCYQLNSEDFANEGEAKRINDLIMIDLFPGLKVWQAEVKAEAAEKGFLQNRYGAIRRFYDVQRFDRKVQKWVPGDQAEAAVAFLPASSAFGYFRDVMLRMEEKGWNEKYQLVNTIHDSLLFHCPEQHVDECCRNVTSEISLPSEVLRYAVCPQGLSVEAEASFGPDLAHMREWK
jgi:hypothetical protein